MVQLTIAHPTSVTSSNLQENLFYDLNGSLFHPNVDFPITHTPFHGLFSLKTPSSHPLLHVSRQFWSPIFTKLFTSNPSPPGSVFFQSRITITYVTTHQTRTLHFTSIYGIRMPSQHSKPTRILSNTISKSILEQHNNRNTSTFR